MDLDYRLGEALAEELITIFNEFTLRLAKIDSKNGGTFQQKAADEVIKQVQIILAVTLQHAEREADLDQLFFLV